MDKHWQALEQLTKELVSRIGEASFEEIEAYMERRNQLFSYLQRQQLSDTERRAYNSVAIRIDQDTNKIIKRMLELKAVSVAQLNKMASGKKQQQAYYPEPQEYDSVFFDKKR